MKELTICIYLGICGGYDWKYKEIPVWLLRAGCAGGLAWALVESLLGRRLWYQSLLGLIPGALMLLYSRVTEGKLGSADGILVMGIGLACSWEKCVFILMTACFLIFFLAVLLVVTKKGSRNTRIPFAPFLFSATGLCWIAESLLNGGRWGG